MNTQKLYLTSTEARSEYGQFGVDPEIKNGGSRRMSEIAELEAGLERHVKLDLAPSIPVANPLSAGEALRAETQANSNDASAIQARVEFLNAHRPSSDINTLVADAENGYAQAA